MKEIRRLTLFCLLVVTVGFAAISFWYDLGGYALLDNNEGIYAQIAREMWESGNYVTPFFNGMPYLEKPPLLFWLTALSYQLFGVSEFAARVVPALSASLLFLLAIWSGWRLFNPLTGTLAGLILASSVTVAVLGRTLIFDMLMTLLLSAGLIWIYCWFDTQKRRFALLAAGALGLAVLTKGLLPLVLVGLAVVTFAVSVQMPLTTLKRLAFDPYAIAVFLAIAAPWHIAASLVREGFAHFYFINEHGYRFLGIREPNDYFSGPIYYYLPRVLLYLAPWSVLVAYLFIRPASKLRPLTPLHRYLWCWAISNLLFFSIAQNKANYYAFVVVLPLALLLADRMYFWIMHRYEAGMWALAVTASGLVTMTVYALMFACGPQLNDLYPFCKDIQHHDAVGFALIFGVALLGGLLRGLGWRRFAPVLILAGLSLPLLNLGLGAVRHYESKISQRTMAAHMNQTAPQADVYVVNKLSDVSSLRFYLERNVSIVDNDDADLYTGLNSPEGQGCAITMDKLLRSPKPNPIFVAVNPDHEAFKDLSYRDGLCLFRSSPKLVVYSNQKCLDKF